MKIIKRNGSETVFDITDRAYFDGRPNILSVYIKGFENENQVGTVLESEGKISGKRYYDQFDWVKFLTE